MVFYFWCSEKSQYLGNEMLRKMNDLLIRKPSLAELTGISDGRLNSFVTQLRAYLHGSVVSKAQSIGVLPSNGPSDDDSFDSSELHYPQSSFTCEKRSLFQQYGCRGLMTNLNHLDGLYPKSGSFEASLPKSLSSENVTARENLMQVGDGNASPNSLFLASTSDADLSNSIGFAKGKLPKANLVHSFSVLNVVDAFGKPLDVPLCGPKVQVHSSGPSHLSPQYCWCPPVASALHYTLRNSQMSTESLHLPPLSSLLASKSSPSLSEVPAMDFPSFQPHPLVTSLATSQQIPTFTPLMCDPIVHIPIYSSGPGLLVSTGPAIATTIPPLNLNRVDPRITNSESSLEQGARETLRMLINGTNSQPNSKLLEMLPPVLSSSDDIDKPNLLSIGGSRGFYCGTRDVSGGPSNMSFMFLSDKSPGGGFGSSSDDSVDKERPQDFDSSGLDSGME